MTRLYILTGLNLLNAHLPCGPESFGMLWDIFHRDVLETIHSQVQPTVEIAAAANCDYIVGCQLTQPGQIEGLASFTVPAGDYVRGIFFTGSFEELAGRSHHDYLGRRARLGRGTGPCTEQRICHRDLPLGRRFPGTP